ncbi:MAG: M28 family peptidase [Flavobacteriaceae bacterium]|nr:M28 family peptidase [Flavobacteriaceae bacterium]
MKKMIFLLLGLGLACNSSQKPVADTSNEVAPVMNAVSFAQTITEEDLREHLVVYASDEYAGRETGTPGQKLASEYIKSAYEALEIPAAKNDGDYFQKVPLELTKLPNGTVSIDNTTYSIGTDFITFSQSESSHQGLVFAGYGIDTEGYSDYANLDVTDKIVLIKAGEPKNEDGTYVISGTEETSVWSNMSEAIGKKSEVANDQGASGIFYYDPVNYPRFEGYYNYMRTNDRGQMQVISEDSNTVMILMNTELAKKVYPTIETATAGEALDIPISFSLKSNNEVIDTENVISFIKGSEKPDEYVVISSHLDHIGVNADGNINNGADDDGSGTVAMLEIAEAFAEAAKKGQGPKRSVVFLHVTGEEKGLLGSQYYTDYDPIFPLANTVANLNIDMIGRIDPKRQGGRNYVYLIGSDKLSQELHTLSETINTTYTNLELDYKYNDENDPNRFYYRSDHYNFAKNNIPIIFYFNGTHDDYHRPSDTVEKINFDLLQTRTQLIFHTAWEVANRDNRVAVDTMTK